MCGIVGVLANRPAAAMVMSSLQNLEYRGYDSAGLATLENGQITNIKAEGKLKNLQEKLADANLNGHVAIGHTRWATHGAPVESNAHPHATDRVAVVHNGIIENFAQLREELESKGVVFTTETDTEVVAHLVTYHLNHGDTAKDAVYKTLQRLRGAFSLVFMFAGLEDCLIVVRHGPSMCIGYGDREAYVGSDAIALAPFTNKITYLEDGDWAVIGRDLITIYGFDGQEVERKIEYSTVSNSKVSKEPFDHFMQKEIYEQVEVLSYGLAHYLDLAHGTIRHDRINIDWEAINRVSFTACGTAYIATEVAKYWFEKYAGLLVTNDVASEFRYRNPILDEKTLVICVSQSGETADTLASLKLCKQQNIQTLSVVNVIESTIARTADQFLPILAGTEIGVASTKAFMCQLLVLAVVAISAGRARGKLSLEDEKQLVQQLQTAPHLIAEVLKLDQQVKDSCDLLLKARSVLYLGRGVFYPIALEGALKLKELSYLHAEGYAAGELKHGPIALIDDSVPVIVIAPFDELFEKALSNMQEVAARGGKILLITDAAGAKLVNNLGFKVITIPSAAEIVAPLVACVPAQLIAYHVAVGLGSDVDQPRNLAKSVTVE